MDQQFSNKLDTVIVMILSFELDFDFDFDLVKRCL
jgi:hypothetical protein